MGFIVRKRPAVIGQPDATENLELLEWLATISTEHADELRSPRAEERKAKHDRELLEWLAKISEPHDRELRLLERGDPAVGGRSSVR